MTAISFYELIEAMEEETVSKQPLPEQPVAQPTSIPPIPEEPKKDWLKIGVLVLAGLTLLSAAGYAGYYLASRQQVLPKLAEGPTPSVTDPTADWKTYKNEKYGYSIKYLQDWSYQLTDNLNYLNNFPEVKDRVPYFGGIQFVPSGQTLVDSPYITINIEILANPEGLSIKEYFNKYHYLCVDEATEKPIYLGQKIVESGMLSVGGRAAHKWDAPGCATPDREALLFSRWVIFSQKDKIFRMAVFKNSEIKDESIFDLMLQTFQFTE